MFSNGYVINGRYRVERPLDQGGMGEVYLCADEQLLGRAVVLKAPSPTSFSKSWNRQKFLQEIEALSRMDHPGVIYVHEMGTLPDGRPFFIMPFVEGSNLRVFIREGGLPFDTVREYARQIVDALACAHRQNILHRDLKPENIMVQRLPSGRDHIRLIDFGLAKVELSVIDAGSHVDVTAGTRPYMAPELFMNQPATVGSDIYALGVIVHELLTGRHPFRAKSVYERLDLERTGCVPIGLLRPDLPATVIASVVRALSYDRAKRQTSVFEFGAELLGDGAVGIAPRSSAHGGPRLSAQPAAVIPGDNATILPLSDSTGLSDQQRLSLSPHGSASEGRFKDNTTLGDNVGAGRKLVVLHEPTHPSDHAFVLMLKRQLTAQGFEVYADTDNYGGGIGLRELEVRVPSADAVLVIVSVASLLAESLTELATLCSDIARQTRGDRPLIVPVRMGYLGPLPPNLAGRLDTIHVPVWHSVSEDETRFVDELIRAITFPVKSTATPIDQLSQPGGALPLGSPLYIQRTADDDFASALNQKVCIVLIKGPRQSGKTSLLARGLNQMREEGLTVVLTDLQKLTASQLGSLQSFYQSLLESLALQLGIDVPEDSAWNPKRSPNMIFEQFLRRSVFGRISGHLVWGLDEVDRVFTTDFSNDVFGLFRSWHNERSLDPSGPWQNLTLAIGYASEAQLFITDLNQSPFNVGTRIFVHDFTLEQVADLNRRYRDPLRSVNELKRFFSLVGGQPYLVQRGMYEMVKQKLNIQELEDVACSDEGPFADHLRRILIVLGRDSAMCEAMRSMLRGNPRFDSDTFFRMRSAGLLTGPSPLRPDLRCRIYGDYLSRHLV